MFLSVLSFDICPTSLFFHLNILEHSVQAVLAQNCI